MAEAVLKNQQWHLYMTFLLQVQFNFGIVCGIDAVLKGLSGSSDQEGAARGRQTAISDIKSICEAFNQTIAQKIGKEAEQVLVDHYSAGYSWFQKFSSEIETTPLDLERVAYYVDLYRSILSREIPPGELH